MLLMWVLLVFVAARTVPIWQPKQSYEALLPASAVQVLQQQPRLQFDVFALPGSPAASLVDNFLQPLIQGLKQAEVNYIDAAENPEWVQQRQVKKQGEMIISNGTADFKLSTLSYEAFFNGLKKLNQPADQWVVFLDQLNGKSFDPGQPGSLRDWLDTLQAANYPLMVLPWQVDLQLPAQAGLIVLPSPAVALTADHIQWLEKQINAGISVLWLVDPNTVLLQPELALMFDLMRTDAFDAGQLVVKTFTAHSINQQFDRPLDLVDVVPFETANQVLWRNQQQQAIAATQEIGNSRLMVIGDSDFLSNELINSGGNMEMSFRLLDWLMQHESRIDLPSIGLGQSQLFFSQAEVLSFAGVMLLLIPGVFLLISFICWRKQKRG